MANLDFPCAEHLDDTVYGVTGPPNLVILPRPPLNLRHEQEEPVEDGMEDVDGDFCFPLPVFVRVDVCPQDAKTECFMICTKNKRGFDRGGDGLSLYASVERTDFTFRTQVFGGFPEVIQHNKVKLELGQWNEMALVISERQATYWINRVPVATCNFREGDLPASSLYFGLTRFAHNYRFRRFDVSRDPVMLSVFGDRVITLQRLEAEDDVLRVRCLMVSGNELATLEVVGASELLPGTEVSAAREIEAFSCAEQGERTVYDSTTTVRLPAGPVGVVRSQFHDGSVTLSLPQALSDEARRHQGVCRRRGRAPNDARLAYLQADRVGALQAQGGERLGEFRGRVADQVGTLPHNLNLVLPDGTLLPSQRDAEPLLSLLQPAAS